MQRRLEDRSESTDKRQGAAGGQEEEPSRTASQNDSRVHSDTEAVRGMAAAGVERMGIFRARAWSWHRVGGRARG